MNIFQGGCHCGNIRYTISTESHNGYYCHCRMCQLSFGNIFAAFMNIKKADIEWTKALPTYYKSSKFAQRGFCGKCGTPLTFEFDDSENMDISIGSLDVPDLTKPESHFASESIIYNWFTEDGLPKKRADEHEKLQGYWKKYYGNEPQTVETARKHQQENNSSVDFV